MEDAYLAGLFDGEGSVGIYRTTNGKKLSTGRPAPSAKLVYWYVRLSIAGTHRPMIETVVAHMPGASFIGDRRTKGHRTPGKMYSQGQCRPSFKAQITKRDQVATFLRRIRPFLLEKAVQADIVFQWLDGDINGARASLLCKKAKRFKFSNIAVRRRKDHC